MLENLPKAIQQLFRNRSLNKQELSWILYDVGNSAFVLVMVTAIMPIYFKDVAAATMGDTQSTAYWGYANSTASLILALLSPVIGTLSDFQHLKKRVFVFLWLIGLACTLLLSLIDAGNWLLCLFFFVIARICWAGANIVYDSFLVDVAGPKRMDQLSSYGFGWGYIGSVIPFLAIIALIMAAMKNPDAPLPIAETQIAFVIVALWWAVFTLPLIKNVPQQYWQPITFNPVKASFKRILNTLKSIRSHRDAFVFLIAYFFYIDGVGTVITMSMAYGRDLQFSATMLITVILFIQVIAFPFVMLFSKLAGKLSTKKVLLFGIYAYCIATCLAFFMPSNTDPQLKNALFWLMAFLVGSSMGGVQALSRSYFAKLIPPQSSGEFFGFYNIIGKFAAILGPFLVGLIGTLTGHTRWGILSLLLLFLIGAIILKRVSVDKRPAI